MARPLPRTASALAAAVAVALGVSACGGAAEPVVPEPVTVSPEIEERRTTPPEPEVPVVWPLTGVPVEEVAQRPAVAVKIENTSTARPQSGLESADVVWETIIEFEVSRLIAVFHSQYPTEVGPIRSVRPMDAPIVKPTGGLIAFSGGQPGILQEVQGYGVQSVSHDAGVGGMYRVGHRRAPHNVFGSVEQFAAVADAAHSAPPGEQFGFALDAAQATAAVAGTPASSLSFRLSAQSSPSWTWDAGQGRWLRHEGGAPAMSAAGAQLSATNVVALTAPHPNSGYGAQGGAPVPTYETVGSGEAVVATGGKTVAGTWKRGSVDEPIKVYDAEGEEILLAPGNTWVEMIPAGKGSLTIG